MNESRAVSLKYVTKTYYLLTKPGIIMGNAVTMAAGLLLASKGSIDFFLAFMTLLGLSCIIGAACVFNNYIDRKIDQKMHRTKNRAFVQGTVSRRNAFTFGGVLFLLGSFFLVSFTNLLAFSMALVGFFIYVFVYSFLKTKTVHNTLIGSVAGAMPPVVGYAAVTNRVDAGAIVFFFMIVFWQMPHFYAIAIYRFRDYQAAEIPLLPMVKGMKATKNHMLFYIVLFMIACSFLTILGYTGKIYLTISLILGVYWLYLSTRGFFTEKDRIWAREMFLYSLVVVMGICLAIPFDIPAS